jgi:hypothetical protein
MEEFEKLGWVLANEEDGTITIQKWDELDRFDTDEEALIHVAQLHLELLTAVKYARRFLKGEDVDIEYLDKVIKKAEGEIK